MRCPGWPGIAIASVMVGWASSKCPNFTSFLSVAAWTCAARGWFFQWQPGWVFRTTWNQNVVIDHLLKNMMFTQFHVGSTGPMRSARNMWGRILNCPVFNMNLYLFGYQGKLGATARCYCIMTVYQDGYGEMNHQQTWCKTGEHQVDTWHVQSIQKPCLFVFFGHVFPDVIPLRLAYAPWLQDAAGLLYKIISSTRHAESVGAEVADEWLTGTSQCCSENTYRNSANRRQPLAVKIDILTLEVRGHWWTMSELLQVKCGQCQLWSFWGWCILSSFGFGLSSRVVIC